MVATLALFDSISCMAASRVLSLEMRRLLLQQLVLFPVDAARHIDSQTDSMTVWLYLIPSRACEKGSQGTTLKYDHWFCNMQNPQGYKTL